MNLLDYKKDKYSSTGNDGIVEKIFDTLNIKKGFFVEFGAWDGIKGSNCRKLFEEGWSGVFIEPVPERFNELKINYNQADNIECINSLIDLEHNTFDSVVDSLIRDEFDFCSIDIDGLDVEVFETFEKYMPKVICIEGGQMLEPFHERLPIVLARNNIQQSLKIMVEVFQQKGYRLLCTYQDTFFIKNEYFDLFDVSKDIMEQYLNGLSSLHRRLPWIQLTIGQVGLRNKIIDYILQNSDYYDYGYNKRKVWEKERAELTLQNIQNLKNDYFRRAKG